jgi:hypothetical protein
MGLHLRQIKADEASCFPDLEELSGFKFVGVIERVVGFEGL